MYPTVTPMLGSMNRRHERNFVAVFQLDSRAFRTARRLLFRPGELTADYLAGRRASQVPPLQTYALAAALLFLAGTVHPIVRFHAPSFQFYAGLAGGIGWTNRLSAAEIARLSQRGLSPELFGERFVNGATSQLSSLLILSVPLFALGVWLLHPRMKRAFTHHLMFALHWSAFFFVLTAVLQLLPPRISQDSLPLNLTVLLVETTYLVVALRRVYGSGRLSSVARGALLMIAYQVILMVWLEQVVGHARSSI